MQRALTLLSLGVLSLGSAAGWGDAQPHPPPPRVTADVRALAGCYRLSPRWLETPGNYPGAAPLPARMRLDTVPQRYVGRTPDFRAGPAITTQHEFATAPGWRPLGRDSLEVSWWDGYTGPTLVLRRSGGGWRGVATYYYHEKIGPGPRAAVEAVRAPCE